MKECKGGTTQINLNEVNESIDGENHLLEIVEEDNSPTPSSTSVNSFGLENSLLENLKMEVNNQVQNIDGRVHNTIVRECENLLKSKDILFAQCATSKNIVSGSTI